MTAGRVEDVPSLRGGDERRHDVNVWPAVTDTMLLMASIFIVLSVVTMVSVVSKVSPNWGKGTGGDELLSLTYHIQDGILFQSGKAALRPAAPGVLRGLLQLVPDSLPSLRRYAERQNWKSWYVVLEASGHTDADPLRSALFPGGDGNWDLSTSRANAVIQTVERIVASDGSLRERLGIQTTGRFGEAAPGSTVLRAAGYSSHLPQESNDKDANRRVEIRVYAEPEEVLRAR